MRRRRGAAAPSGVGRSRCDARVATTRQARPRRDICGGRCRGRGDGALRVVDDALGTVPVGEYETVFSFPTVGKNSEMCLTRCRGFWLTFYVDAAVTVAKTREEETVARSMRAFEAGEFSRRTAEGRIDTASQIVLSSRYRLAT